MKSIYSSFIYVPVYRMLKVKLVLSLLGLDADWPLAKYLCKYVLLILRHAQ